MTGSRTVVRLYELPYPITGLLPQQPIDGGHD